MDTAARAAILRIPHIGQLLYSIYGGYISYIAITNLQKYEEISKKAAEWSKEAESQLWKTRTTQASGALAILASNIGSFSLAVFQDSLPKLVRMLTSPALLIGILFARGHIKNYWAPKDGKNITRIPLPRMEDYNEAERKTEALLKILEYLEYSWVVTSLIVGLVGF